MTANEFVGMEKRAAQNLAERKNMIFRLVSADGETMLGWPPEGEDKRDDRVCCIVQDSCVVQAEIR